MVPSCGSPAPYESTRTCRIKISARKIPIRANGGRERILCFSVSSPTPQSCAIDTAAELSHSAEQHKSGLRCVTAASWRPYHEIRFQRYIGMFIPVMPTGLRASYLRAPAAVSSGKAARQTCFEAETPCGNRAAFKDRWSRGAGDKHQVGTRMPTSD